MSLAPSVLISSQELPFEKVAHRVATLNAQPSNEQGGIIVMVTGALLVSHFAMEEPVGWEDRI